MLFKNFILVGVVLLAHACKKPGEKTSGTDDGIVTDRHMEAANTPATKTEGDGYISYFSGSSTDVSPPTKSSILLVGGGTDRDDAMQWFVDRAGKGDIVVIRASGSDGYNQFLLAKGANSVRSIVVTSEEGAEQKDVLDALNKSEGIFFAGGDQSFYVKYLKKTKLDRAIDDAAIRGVPIGGTSAGLAILGQYLYSALYDSLQTSDALKNPFHHDLTLDKDFLALPVMTGSITDSHFKVRDRMGRLLAFLARINKDKWHPTPHGLGIDEGTAVAVNEDGIGSIFTDDGFAYALTMTKDPAVCEDGQPLTLEGVEVYKLGKDAKIDFKTWVGTGGSSYSLSVKAGVVSTASGSIY